MKGKILFLLVTLLCATTVFAESTGWTSVPESGSTVEQISSLTLTYNGLTPTFKSGLELTDISFKLDGAPIDFGQDLRSQPRYNGNTVTFPAPLEDGGKYTFHFNAGSFTVTENGKKVDCPEADITIYVKAEVVEWNEPFSVFPPMGAKRPSMNGYTYLQFTDVTAVEQTADYAIECSVDGVAAAAPTQLLCSGNTIFWHYNKTAGAVEAGKYQLHSKAGNFTLTKTNGDKELSPEFTITYEIAAGAAEISCSPTPGSAPLLPLTNFKITPGAGTIAFGDNVNYKEFTIEIGNKVLKYGTDFIEDEDDITLFLFDKPMNVGGMAIVNIPAGFYLVNDRSTPQYRWNFYGRHPQPDFTLTPAPGAIVKGGVEQLTIHFDGDYNTISLNENVASTSDFKIFAGDKVLTYPDDFTLTVDNDIIITLKNKIVEDCNVSVNVPAGVFNLSYSDDDVLASPGIPSSAWYFISTITASPKISSIPANGSTVAAPLKTIKIDYDKELVKNVAISEDASRFDFVIVVNDRNVYLGIGYDFDPDDPTIAILRNPVTTDAKVEVEIEPGYYVMTLANGATALSSYFLSSFDVKYQEPTAPVFTILPQENTTVASVADLKEIEYSINDEYCFGGFETDSRLQVPAALYFENEAGEREKVLNYLNNGQDGDRSIVYAAEDYDSDEEYKEGKYIFEIPTDALFYYSELVNLTKCETKQYSYRVDSNVGVQNTSASERYTVYTLTGIRLMTDVDKETLQQLHPGLYIVNGRKVEVRK